MRESVIPAGFIRIILVNETARESTESTVAIDGEPLDSILNQLEMRVRLRRHPGSWKKGQSAGLTDKRANSHARCKQPEC